jgi:hypothetical protein
MKKGRRAPLVQSDVGYFKAASAAS